MFESTDYYWLQVTMGGDYDNLIHLDFSTVSIQNFVNTSDKSFE